MSDETRVLTREEFFQTAGLKRDIVPLSRGGAVYVSEPSAGQVILFNERLKSLKGKGKKNTSISPTTSIELTALLLSMTVCDAEGDLLFTEADVKRLVRTNLDDFMTLGAKALELAGLNADAVQEVKDQLKKTTKVSSS
jgi:hypothetical protein